MHIDTSCRFYSAVHCKHNYIIVIDIIIWLSIIITHCYLLSITITRHYSSLPDYYLLLTTINHPYLLLAIFAIIIHY